MAQDLETLTNLMNEMQGNLDAAAATLTVLLRRTGEGAALLDQAQTNVETTQPKGARTFFDDLRKALG